MRMWKVALTVLLLAGCGGQDVLRGGSVKVGLKRTDDFSGRHFYSMSCRAGDMSPCERAAVQVCPDGPRITQHRVRTRAINGRRVPVRDMVFTCR